MNTQDSMDTEANALLEDAKKRNVVWDAEMNLSSAQVHADGMQNQNDADGLLGQRMEDGAVLPIGSYVSGKEAAQVKHVGQLVFSISLEELARVCHAESKSTLF